jgi:type IV secretion system protein VirD4
MARTPRSRPPGRGKGGGRVTDFLGQDVYIVDPFQIVPNVTRAAFNPLAGIDPASPHFAEEIALLVEALVLPANEGAASHWEETARMLIGGIAAFLLTTQPHPTLVDLRAMLERQGSSRDELIAAMQNAGPHAAAAASLLLHAGPNERESIFTTALRHTDWLISKAMQALRFQTLILLTA